MPMYRAIKAKIHKESKYGTHFYVLVPNESLTDEVQKLSHDGVLKGELHIDDGRTLSAVQRKKSYATLADIALHLGYPPEELKELMKYQFVAHTGEKYFSFRNCSMTTARHFINYIINFALEWEVPLAETLLERTDDIDTAIYMSLKHKKCIICGKDGEIHHWDAIGMGHDRVTFDDSKLRKLCLCRQHHSEVHKIGREVFEQKYHAYGVEYKERSEV